ncbi:nucleic acid-binding protein [Candidatus Scalindua japonica]|uniref:Nucleic acid-binding protein n=1 Tax=Candidatus Scalindua japonica TaxID=1284222 RepID=A0A286TUN5_9BACT|nr:type II toxin-antitoxin system VapC family toxin [Candidatus Scalindua japonica]GAX59574.1 nucleic acid-binding protein [Candidatus Scalindua japonica]
MITSIDTNILLDILLVDNKFALDSKNLIDFYNQKGQLIICELVYAELSSQFPSDKELSKFLNDTSIKLVYSNEKSLALSGERWKKYSRSRKNTHQCHSCGKKFSIHCPHCKHNVRVRQHIISDFIIAAHALNQATLLLSRDRGFLKSCFSDLEVKGKLP